MLREEDWSTAVLTDALGDDSDAALRRLSPGLRPALPSRRLAQDHVVREVLRNVRAWFPNTPVLIDRRRRVGGRVVSSLRPDLQFYNPRRRNETYIEVDTNRQSMLNHIALRDPNRRNVFLLVHPTTGVVIEKQVYAAGASQPIIRHGTPSRPLQLTRNDVFDAFNN